jgi:APA family basic amino acid/polyamine antiporter
VLAVIAIAALNLRGITRTARAATVIVIAVLAVLVLVITAGAAASFDGAGTITNEPVVFGGELLEHGWFGILQSAGLLFFAFAGYARIATLGEEVRRPSRTIPRAIGIALGIAVVVYAAVGAVALGALGADGLAASVAPLVDVVEAADWRWAAPIVRIGAAVAALGALLALIAGIGRTALAMARDDELPRALAAVHPRFQVPHVAEITVALVIIALVATVDLRGAIGFSSFGVLLYYFVANAAALTQPKQERRVPRALSVAGAIGCLVLVATLPLVSIVAGVAVLAVGAAYRLIVRGARSRRSGPRDRPRVS